MASRRGIYIGKGGGCQDSGRRALRRGRELAVRLQDQLLAGFSRSERAALLRSLEEIERTTAPV